MIPVARTFAEVWEESCRSGRAFRLNKWPVNLYALAAPDADPIAYVYLTEEDSGPGERETWVGIDNAVARVWTMESDELFQARRNAENALAHLRQLRDKAVAQAQAAIVRHPPIVGGNSPGPH